MNKNVVCVFFFLLNISFYEVWRLQSPGDFVCSYCIWLEITQGHISGANKTPKADAHHYHQLGSGWCGVLTDYTEKLCLSNRSDLSGPNQGWILLLLIQNVQSVYRPHSTQNESIKVFQRDLEGRFSEKKISGSPGWYNTMIILTHKSRQSFLLEVKMNSEFQKSF